MEIPKERKCTKCGIVKPLTGDFFDTSKVCKYGLSTRCIICRRKYIHKWRHSSKSPYKDSVLRTQLKNFGTTIEWYRDNLIVQLGLCAICGHLSHIKDTVQRLQVDHDHNCCDLYLKSCGKCLRGLLCSECNLKLSHLEQLMKDFANYENSEVYLRNSVLPDSWTYKALRYLKSYTQENLWKPKQMTALASGNS